MGWLPLLSRTTPPRQAPECRPCLRDADGRRPARRADLQAFPRFPGPPASHTHWSFTKTEPDSSHGGSCRALSATLRRVFHPDGFTDRFRACIRALTAKLGPTPLLQSADGRSVPCYRRPQKQARSSQDRQSEALRTPKARALPPAAGLSPATLCSQIFWIGPTWFFWTTVKIWQSTKEN